jgi:hypothetical protein
LTQRLQGDVPHLTDSSTEEDSQIEIRAVNMLTLRMVSASVVRKNMKLF